MCINREMLQHIGPTATLYNMNFFYICINTHYSCKFFVSENELHTCKKLFSVTGTQYYVVIYSAKSQYNKLNDNWLQCQATLMCKSQQDIQNTELELNLCTGQWGTFLLECLDANACLTAGSKTKIKLGLLNGNFCHPVSGYWEGSKETGVVKQMEGLCGTTINWFKIT